MPPSYFKANTDKNHAEVKHGIEAAGYKVFDTHRAGDGFPDIVVKTKGRPAIFVALEIKAEDDKNGLRGKEINFFADTEGAPRHVVHTVEQALTFLAFYDSFNFITLPEMTNQ